MMFTKEMCTLKCVLALAIAVIFYMQDYKLGILFFLLKKLLKYKSHIIDPSRYQCFCANSFGTYGPASNCNNLCNGNSYEICGGTWANAVYSTQCPQSKKKTRSSF